MFHPGDSYGRHLGKLVVKTVPTRLGGPCFLGMVQGLSGFPELLSQDRTPAIVVVGLKAPLAVLVSAFKLDGR